MKITFEMNLEEAKKIFAALDTQNVEKKEFQATPNPVPLYELPLDTLPVAPTQAPTPAISMEELARAATQLIDLNRREELVALLQTFGATSLATLPQDKYVTFAEHLKAKGVKF